MNPGGENEIDVFVRQVAKCSQCARKHKHMIYAELILINRILFRLLSK